MSTKGDNWTVERLKARAEAMYPDETFEHVHVMHGGWVFLSHDPDAVKEREKWTVIKDPKAKYVMPPEIE